jgi:hypothetical protein
MCGRYVLKIRNIKVQEISFSGMALAHDEQTDGHDKTSSRPSLANATYNYAGSVCELNALLSTACSQHCSHRNRETLLRLMVVVIFNRPLMEGPACLAAIIRIETKRVVGCVYKFK